MLPLTNRRLLFAVQALSLLLLLIPGPAESVERKWVDQIAQRLQMEHQLVNDGDDRYLRQLDFVQNALVRGNVSAAQREMSHLVGMVATRKGGLSETSAESLLLYISDVTPVEYLDETTKSHLRLIRAMVRYRSEIVEDVPADSSYGLKVTPRTASWDWSPFQWMGEGRVSPLIQLGAGVLLLVTIGGIVLLVLGVAPVSHSHHRKTNG